MFSPGVAGTTVPAFVERTSCARRTHSTPSVAGTTVPAFVERRHRRSKPATCCPGVAGTTVPAFVERTPPSTTKTQSRWCRRGLRSRPSLSETYTWLTTPRAGYVSPGLRSRPSLSAKEHHQGARRGSRVAGTTVPAFVERGITPPSAELPATRSPGLRSRPSLSAVEPRRDHYGCREVSPGLRSRPSLSEGVWKLSKRQPPHVSPGLRSRPSLSVRNVAVHAVRPGRCRRDYGPGLR